MLRAVSISIIVDVYMYVYKSVHTYIHMASHKFMCQNINDIRITHNSKISAFPFKREFFWNIQR